MAENLTDLSDEAFAELRAAVQAETSRRRTLRRASAEMDILARETAAASGQAERGAWAQPVVGGFPIGWLTVHAGKLWRSTTPNNVFEPGVSGWREETLDGAAPAPYRQPTGAHDAYKHGERITWTDGKIYEATRSGVVHSPTQHAASWTLVTIVTSTPPPVTVTYEPWVAGKAYPVGWSVSFGGRNYRVKQAHTSQAGWTPPAVPALFDEIV